MAALVRTAFPFPARTPSWFAGHMARSLRELPSLLDEVDLVLEARDSRLPLTSVNPAFDALLERVWGHCGSGYDRRGKGKEKIVIYTKRDLAEARYEEPLRQALWEQARQRVRFVDSRVDSDLREVLKMSASAARERGNTSTELKVLVVGMPNVGKSSLLNGLRRVGVRKGKAFNTGAMPGVTRKLTGTVRVYEKPPIYVFDTPGVMVPYLGHDAVGAERGLKLALTAGIKEGLFEPEVIADYLLYKLNLRLAAERGILPPLAQEHSHETYTEKLPLPSDFMQTDHLPDFLDALAFRLGALRKGGERDVDAALTFFIRQFREGRLGRWTLDDLDGVEAAYIAQRGPAAVSGELTQGEVGAIASSVDDSIPGPQLAPTLQERVSNTMGSFLEQSAVERADADAGRNLSPTQQKKVELRAKAEHRLAKVKAKGLDKASGGYHPFAHRPRGPSGRRPSGRPRRR